jgi:hypothetical protein
VGILLMKKAKVCHKHKRIEHVWPWEKTLPDGRKVIKQIPPIYLAKGDKFDHCIIDVPDEVQPGWRWSEEKQAYRPKSEVLKVVPRGPSSLLSLLSKKLGVPYDELYEELKEEKRRVRNLAKTPSAD